MKMKHIGKILLYGFLLWLTVFVGSFFIFPLKQTNPPFFETLISLILAGSTVLYGHIYFQKEKISLKSCLLVGLAWVIINLVIDLPLFSAGPMEKTFSDYMTDIGLTYLMIPIILSVFAFKRYQDQE
jgi:uncharacterized membrane protein YpjA